MPPRWYAQIIPTMIVVALVCGSLFTAHSFTHGRGDREWRGTFVAFGPYSVVRAPGSPTTVTTTFTILNPITIYALRLSNGGLHSEFARVSSAIVTLNGVEVIRPKDLKKTVVFLDIPVILSSTNTLTVEVRGQPGSGLGLQILGIDTDLPHLTMIAPTPGARLTSAAVHVTGTVRDRTSGIAEVTCHGVAASVAAGTFQCDLTLSEGRQTITAQATDRAGHRNTTSVGVIVTTNQIPLARAGAGQTVGVGQTVTLDGSTSTDADGDLLSYAWSLVTVPAGSHAVLDDPTLVRPTFVVDGSGSYVGQLVVNDGQQDSTPATVSITTRNSPPVAHAGPDHTVAVGTTAQLDGSQSSDVDGDALLFTWAFLSHPATSTAVLSTPYDVRSTLVIDHPGTYVVQLTVHDGLLASTPDTVSLTTRNSPPVAQAGPDQTVLVGDTVQLTGRLSSDVDGDTLTFRWSFLTRPSGSNAILSDPTIVQPTFVVDQPGLYVVQLLVHDSQLDSVPDTVSITTQNTRPVAHAGLDQSIFVGDTGQLDGRLSSDADGDPLQYRWSLSTTPPGSLAILSDASATTPSFLVDFPGLYVAQLVVHDGALDSAPDTVALSTQNSPPVAQAGPDQTVFIGETVRMDGSASRDADGDPLTSRWALIALPTDSAASLSYGPPVPPEGDGEGSQWSEESLPSSGESPTETETTAVHPTFVADRPGTYVAQLIVHDGTVESAPDTVVVTAVNRAPVAQAGLDQTVVVGTTVQLDGRASRDPDGDPLTYAWTVLIHPAASTTTLTGATTSLATFVAEQSGTYGVQLVVHDGMVASAPHVLTIVTRPAPLDVRQILVTGSTDGQVTVTGQTPPGTSGTSVTATNTRTGQVVTVAVTLDGRFTLAIAAQAGDTVVLVFTDAAGVSSAAITVPIGGTLPPDPTLMAPPLDPTVATTLASATAFLYTGPTPLQRGVAAGTLVPQRVAVVRGKVLDRTGHPLPGVTITIKDHPELGETISRANGLFDLVVNGGGLLTVQYTKPGWLSAQRQVQTPWQDYVFVEDVVLVTLDPQVTPITLNSASGMQVAQGSPSRDAAGTRQATLLFPAGTMASMQFANGTTQPLHTLHVRATEYTVGPTGPKAMPGPLPSTSAYTYAVELSVDEALAAGATRVDFSQPVLVYIDNFLGFPVGGIVPVGWYDRNKVAWIPADNGTIVQLLGVDNIGLALLDVDGSGQTAADSTLRAMGISAAEQTSLATLYPVGTSLWRVPITHFTPWDCNWPPWPAPPDDAIPPPPTPPLPEDEWQPDPEDSTECTGCRIEAQSQTLGEEMALPGTPWRVHYRSDRMPGRTTSRIVQIPLSEASVPASLFHITLNIAIAGRQWTMFFPPWSQQTYTFVWDGLDAYGRAVVGDQRATIRIGYNYPVVYGPPSAGFSRAFGQLSTGNLRLAFRPDNQAFTVWKTSYATLRALAPDAAQLGGWSLEVHHAYDVTNGVYYGGDGAKRHAFNGLTLLAGEVISRPFWWRGDGGPATQARLAAPAGVAMAPDGSVYVADSEQQRILRVARDGMLTTVAGTGDYGFGGDGGPAAQAQFRAPTGITLGADGSLYIADAWNARIRRVGPEGLATTIAGNGADGSGVLGAEGVPATQTSLDFPTAVALGPDGSVYIVDAGERRIRRVTPDGLIRTVAGTGHFGALGDGDLAIYATLLYPRGVAVAPDGTLYIADALGRRVRRVGPDGIMTTVAGGGISGSSGEGRLATEIALGWPEAVAVADDGSLYIGDAGHVWRVSPEGRLTSLAGTGQYGFRGDGGPATQAEFRAPTSLALAGDGRVYVADPLNHRLRRIGPDGIMTTTAGRGVVGTLDDRYPPGSVHAALPGFAVGDVALAAPNGTSMAHFDASGRHLRTIDTITGRDAYVFGYDSAGRLHTVTDRDGDVTRFERDVAGRPLAIVAPDGQRTVLTMHPTGTLAAFTTPAGETSQMVYTAGGLLTAFTTPRGHANHFVYDTLGRLTQDINASGGGWTLSHTKNAPGYTNRLTSAEGRTSTFVVEPLPTGVRRHVDTAPDGTVQETRFTPGWETIRTLPDGTTVTHRPGPDLHWSTPGDVSDTITITTPAGLTTITSTGRTATLGDPDNPLRASFLETVTVDGKATTRHFDATTSTWTVTSPLGRIATVQLNSTGRPTTHQIAGLEAVYTTYDPRGRVTATTVGQGADARTATLSYYADGPSPGSLERVTDTLGNSVHFAYDLAGRVTTQTLPDGRAISYAYDANGNLTALTPPGQPAHRFDYTPLDQEETYAPPALGPADPVTRYTYNLDRQLTQITRPDGQTVELSYTPGGHLETLSLPHGEIQYAYAPTTGHLSAVTTPDGSTLRYSYDGFLRAGTTWQGTVGGSVARTFTPDFQVQTLAVNGQAVSFGYDADGLLTQAGDLALTRDAHNGLLTGTALGATATTQTSNAFGELTTAAATIAGTPSYAVTYTRDGLGRITEHIETVAGAMTTRAYTYDPAGRLTAVMENGGPVSTFTYDANGNRVRHNGTTGTYDAQDRLLQYGTTTYTYTGNGEVQTATDTATGQTTTYAYDVLGNLRTVTLPVGTTITYLIDGQQRRIGKQVDGTLVQGLLYQDQLRPIAELDSAGTVVARFIYADKVNVAAYLEKAGRTYRILADHLGSPRLVMDTTDGTIVQRLDYDAFGTVVTDTNPGFQPFGFAGGLYDPDTGLVRFGTRDYDPHVGRWTAKDPIQFAGGDTNLYGYVLNDPMNWIDPFGLAPKDKFYGLPDKFQHWYHRRIKEGRGPNGTQEELEALHAEWLDLGEPGPDNKGKYGRGDKGRRKGRGVGYVDTFTSYCATFPEGCAELLKELGEKAPEPCSTK